MKSKATSNAEEEKPQTGKALHRCSVMTAYRVSGAASQYQIVNAGEMCQGRLGLGVFIPAESWHELRTPEEAQTSVSLDSDLAGFLLVSCSTLSIQ